MLTDKEEQVLEKTRKILEKFVEIDWWMRNSKEWFRADKEDLGKYRTKRLGSRK